jgi:hypothetical protein
VDDVGPLPADHADEEPDVAGQGQEGAPAPPAGGRREAGPEDAQPRRLGLGPARSRAFGQKDQGFDPGFAQTGADGDDPRAGAARAVVEEDVEDADRGVPLPVHLL